MKKFISLILFIPLIVSAVSSTGVGVDKTTANLVLPMQIEAEVGITIQKKTIAWDFNRINENSNNPPFPPVTFPEYYEPSQPNKRYYQRISYRVRDAETNNWEVTIVGAGDPFPPCGISLSDIEYGDAAAGVWSPLSMEPQVIASGSGNVWPWERIFQDYRVRVDGDETNTEGSTTEVNYIIQIL